jgi:hypothetical protein
MPILLDLLIIGLWVEKKKTMKNKGIKNLTGDKKQAMERVNWF